MLERGIAVCKIRDATSIRVSLQIGRRPPPCACWSHLGAETAHQDVNGVQHASTASASPAATKMTSAARVMPKTSRCASDTVSSTSGMTASSAGDKGLRSVCALVVVTSTRAAQASRATADCNPSRCCIVEIGLRCERGATNQLTTSNCPERLDRKWRRRLRSRRRCSSSKRNLPI